jgi:poly(ADP-ribose) glycohydrolase ARH3
MMNRYLLHSKFQGAIVGSALGDAIGRRRSDSGDAIFAPLGEMEPWPHGTLCYTDGTAMVIGLAESLVAKHDIDERHLGDQFRLDFLRESWRGYALGPSAVFSRMEETGRRDYHAAAKEIGEALFSGGSFGAGAAMRVASLVFFYDSPDLYDKAEQQARITHTHPIAIDGAAVLAKAISEAVKLHPSPSLDALAFCDLLIAFSHNDVIKEKMTQIKKCIRIGVADTDAAHLLGQSVAAHESAPFAIYSFLKNPASFKDCLLCATGNGGDMDTVGAMACAISGAYLGVDVIPSGWEIHLENAAHILQLAEQLFLINQGLTGWDMEYEFFRMIEESPKVD